jgi:hypothetical protein
LRQGDPISPYPFVLALERLGHRIQDLVNNGNWSPLKFGSGSAAVSISHMMFADDLIMIAEATVDQAHLIRNVLDDFCSKSGQKVNLHKSKVFFSNNMKESNAQVICDILGVEQTSDLGTYLGAPMIHQRITKNTFSFLIDKMRKKLSCWKSNSLSFAGRITLAQSSLTSILGYIMQTCNIPASVCDEI